MQKINQPIISVLAVEISCSCGGACENSEGSYMIGSFDKTVTCSACGAGFDVPQAAFVTVPLRSDAEIKAAVEELVARAETARLVRGEE